MREIKFRAFGKSGRKYTTFNPSTHCEVDFMRFSEAILSYDEIESVEQYTGLKDKNGVEIFEGDIVKFEDPYSNNEQVSSVFFDDGAFSIDSDDWRPCLYEVVNTSIVVGNIHESLK